MKITKYPQSCLVLEKAGRRILIDPGNLVTPRFRLQDLGIIDAVFYTHEHVDHMDAALAREITIAGIPIYANEETAALIEGGHVTVVKHEVGLTVAGFAILPYTLRHSAMIDGSDGPKNTGYLIDGYFLHPGDSSEANGLKSDYAAVPIFGPDISHRDAFQFIADLKAKKIIPVHYHKGGLLQAEYFAENYQKHGGKAEVVVLKDGESFEL